MRCTEAVVTHVLPPQDGLVILQIVIVKSVHAVSKDLTFAGQMHFRVLASVQKINLKMGNRDLTHDVNSKVRISCVSRELSSTGAWQFQPLPGRFCFLGPVTRVLLAQGRQRVPAPARCCSLIRAGRYAQAR